MSINIQTLAVGSLVLNNGQYYKVIAGSPFKQLQLLTQAELATYFEDNSWTLSYSLDTQSWASYHDYTPYGMVNTRTCNSSPDHNNVEVILFSLPNFYHSLLHLSFFHDFRVHRVNQVLNTRCCFWCSNW